MPKKKNSNFSSLGIIHLKSIDNEDKVNYNAFKNQNENKENDYNNNIDLKRVDELTLSTKKENLNLRDSDSPLKPAFKQSKNIHHKSSAEY